MAGYVLRDPGRWTADQRQADQRIAALYWQRRHAGWSLVVVPLLGIAGTVVILRRKSQGPAIFPSMEVLHA